MANLVPLPTDTMLKMVEIQYRRYVVGRVMFCPRTETVLDYRTAVIVENNTGDRLLGVMSPEAWRQIGAQFLAHYPDVTLKNAPQGSPGTETPQAGPETNQSATPETPAPDTDTLL